MVHNDLGLIVNGEIWNYKELRKEYETRGYEFFSNSDSEIILYLYKEDELKRIKIDFQELLNPTRDEDKGNDLWSVFNVVQEKIIDGDFEYIAGTKVRKARQIKNFKQDMDLNSKMFDVALQYVNV